MRIDAGARDQHLNRYEIWKIEGDLTAETLAAQLAEALEQAYADIDVLADTLSTWYSDGVTGQAHRDERGLSAQQLIHCSVEWCDEPDSPLRDAWHRFLDRGPSS